MELIELEINRSHPSLKLRNGGGARFVYLVVACAQTTCSASYASSPVSVLCYRQPAPDDHLALHRTSDHYPLPIISGYKAGHSDTGCLAASASKCLL